MSLHKFDINEDEIRVIHSERLMPVAPPPPEPTPPPKKKRTRRVLVWILSLVVFVVLLILFFVWSVARSPEESYEFAMQSPPYAREAPLKSYVDVMDTVVDGQPLTLLTPRNAVPRLRLGPEALDDSTAVLVVQAADVRGDNGEVVGAFVVDGNLLAKGRSKAGFCAIVDGKLTVGVADNTPYLEEAIVTNGHFFRQYPLVVGGQSVDNVLPSSSLRKALAELDGRSVVVLSHKRMTLNEFARTLVDLGVSNAIYLVGSTAYGFATTPDGSRLEFGERVTEPAPNINYLVWE